ncbi:transposase family protein [Streptomyces halstedii]|uniref:transposase family protein n=1 Tax=Streptomyces halstedii TaxID=1944 RepID=UPI003808EB1E
MLGGQGVSGCRSCCPRPVPGKNLRGWHRRHNRDHAKIRSLGERAMATPKCWRLLRKLRCSTTRITAVVRAVLALELAT